MAWSPETFLHSWKTTLESFWAQDLLYQDALPYQRLSRAPKLCSNTRLHQMSWYLNLQQIIIVNKHESSLAPRYMQQRFSTASPCLSSRQGGRCCKPIWFATIARVRCVHSMKRYYSKYTFADTLYMARTLDICLLGGIRGWHWASRS